MPAKDLSRFNRSLTFTDVVIGRNYYQFNGSSSKIDTGSEWIGTSALTIMGWINPVGWGELNAGRLLDNGSVSFLITSAQDLWLTSDAGVTFITSQVGSLTLNKYQHIAVKRTSSGITNFYVNGILSGAADRSSGTPLAGSTNVVIGNRNGQDRTFNGKLSDLRVYNEVKSAAWIKSDYLRTRNFY